jgi:EF hand
MRRFIGKKLGMVLLASAAVAGVSVAAPEEGRPMRERLLEKYDANRDGQLDASEREAAHKERSAERFKKLDTDGNGVLTLEEFQAGKRGRFGRHGRH